MMALVSFKAMYNTTQRAKLKRGELSLSILAVGVFKGEEYKRPELWKTMKTHNNIKLRSCVYECTTNSRNKEEQ